MINRREFIQKSGMAAGAVAASALLPTTLLAGDAKKPFFEISLAQFSLASDFWNGKLTTLDFPAKAKKDFGISTVEYVAMFFNGKETDTAWLNDLKTRTGDLGVKNNLIMVDGDNIADLDDAKRNKAVESHYKWVDAAKHLGCYAIRVNLGALDQKGTADEVAKAAIDGYGKVLEYGTKVGIDIIVENHISYSCNGAWLANIMKQVNNPRAGVLPDFGNFCIKRTQPVTNDIAGWMGTKCLEEYDKYKGVEELMPYAKGVSAKTHKFDAKGNETEIDFKRMLTIIKKSGFKGIIGIEYEGGLMQSYGQAGYLTNDEGIRATHKLLLKAADAVS